MSTNPLERIEPADNPLLAIIFDSRTNPELQNFGMELIAAAG
jgi:hypothetical protein